MKEIIRPPALQPGDTVAVTALSGQMEESDRDMYERGVAEIEALGLKVRPALVGVEQVWWWASAPPREVGRVVNELFRDPEIRAIWALAGGRFVLSYLDVLDYDLIAANPKPVIGMSDITSVNLAIHSRTGLVTFMADAVLFGTGEWQDLPGGGRARQADAYRRVLMSTEPAGSLPALSTWETWRPGRAEGHLLGGLLHRLMRIQASPYVLSQDRFDGAILFLEDLAIPTINFWHDLQVLRQWGVFDRIAGLVIGPVETVTVMPEAPKTLREVVLDVVGERDIPILGNVNIGHAGPNLPLPLGVRAAMDADALTIDLLEPAVQ